MNNIDDIQKFEAFWKDKINIDKKPEFFRLIKKAEEKRMNGMETVKSLEDVFNFLSV